MPDNTAYRCGAPAGSGMIQIGVSVIRAVTSAAKNSDRSGEISIMVVTCEGIFTVSPPAEET